VQTIDKDISLGDVHGSVQPNKEKNKWKRILSFLGPAYLVSVGYMDPGNWATDLEGGSKFGYSLLWVLLMSNIMALVLQSLCARLGVVYKRDLAQANRDTYPPIVNIALYILAELAIAACDLAEVLGMAIGLKLLFGLPLIWGVGITVLDTFLLLYLQKLGIRRMEAFIIALIAIIFLCFFIQLFMVKPDMHAVALGFLPSGLNNSSLYIAIGIIGATVMPHNLYLHSALVQTRKIGDDDASIKKSLKLYNLDSAIALNLALFVNAAILILSATIFYKNGISTVVSIEDAHQLMANLVGNKYAPILFAIALIAAGQSSTITGTLAGQIIMEGYLQLRINPWLRRLITRGLAIIPAVVVILIAGEEKVTDLLIFSQVILSMQLAFAVIPLIIFVSDKNKMKGFAIKTPMIILSSIIAAIIIILNFKLIGNTAINILNNTNDNLVKLAVIGGIVFFIVLLIATIILPFINKRAVPYGIHQVHKEISEIFIPQNNIVALALDFSDMDSKVISYALQQGGATAQYILIHILESAPAKILGKNTGDAESVQDAHQLEIYVQALKNKGINAQGIIGYRNRITEIARITTQNKADLLVLGAHGHKGFMDYFYGETINEVRHLVQVPVLVVK
jgi:manganese transport protein